MVLDCAMGTRSWMESRCSLIQLHHDHTSMKIWRDNWVRHSRQSMSKLPLLMGSPRKRSPLTIWSFAWDQKTRRFVSASPERVFASLYHGTSNCWYHYRCSMMRSTMRIGHNQTRFTKGDV